MMENQLRDKIFSNFHLENKQIIKLPHIEKKGKYGILFGERGIYDIRNTLNDLTGKEWIYHTNSVIITNYPTTGKESYGHKLRKVHPSPKPPQLMRDIIKFFTKEEGWILDPFVGVGGSLIGCSLCNRNGVGIDLSGKYVEIYKKVCRKENLEEQITICDDARNMEKYYEISSRKFDLILTDPPYCEMMTKKRSGEEKKKNGIAFSTPFTNLKEDIGNLNYNEFLEELKKIVELSIKFLKVKKYLVMFIKDMQPTKKHHNMLHADVINSLSKIENLRFRGYKIWYDKTINLYPFGYPYAYVSNQLHQYILIFRKEKE